MQIATLRCELEAEEQELARFVQDEDARGQALASEREAMARSRQADSARAAQSYSRKGGNARKAPAEGIAPADGPVERRRVR